ncbi:MAG TPA: glycosyltransferase family 39 protein [Pyrinomonadaceae bacterium]|nr:glycosyltransferase family 39 protein [Pyrinomonadaceae bacterium]
MIQTYLTTSTPETVQPDEAATKSFWRLWPWWLVPSLIALALVLYFVDPFIGDWDGIDYTIHSVAGYPSSMALGRNLFIFTNHTLFVIARKLLGLQPEHAYLLFKYAVVAQVPFAVIACWILARSVSKSVYTATTAALLVVFSPVFVLYAGQVMTDVPSVLLLTVAIIIHLKGVTESRVWLVIAGAAILGLGVNLRETVGFYLPWLLLSPFALGWKLRRREILFVGLSCLVFLILAFGWFGYWMLSDPQYRSLWHGWRESMREESSRHPVSITNLLPFIVYLFITAPLVFLTLPFGPWLEWRSRRLTPMLLLWLVAFVADLLLFFNYSTTVNWRYFLTGLPGLAPLGAHWLLRLMAIPLRTLRLAFVVCVFFIVSLATTFGLFFRPVSYEFIERRAMSKEYKHRLAQLPQDAVMISGAQTIAVTYWASIGAGRWETIGTGGGWPGDKLFSIIDGYLSQGRRVFIDADPRWWLVCGWQRDEIPVVVSLERHFRFRRVSETIFELRPLTDTEANDNPDLKRLLPENRPQDGKKCTPGLT